MTDCLSVRSPELRTQPMVLTVKERGRIIISAANNIAEKQGIRPGMAAADAKAIIPGLILLDDMPTRYEKLLNKIGEWAIRYTPVVATHLPDGLILDISGCPHLWGGEAAYLEDIVEKLRSRGYDVRAAIADTVGMAWANARFGRVVPIIEEKGQLQAISPMPPEALRLDAAILNRLHKLGLKQVAHIINMPRQALRRRFGSELLLRIDQVLGREPEAILPIRPVAPYEERLPCLEPITTATGISIALEKTLAGLCKRLEGEGLGIRTAAFLGYRVDGQIERIEIGTSRATLNSKHLFKLFELKIGQITPALGIELFVLEATSVEDVCAEQELLWEAEAKDLQDIAVAELLDRLTGKLGAGIISRFLPQEHYWPERSLKAAGSLKDEPPAEWFTDRPRPTCLLAAPQPIQVTVPLPDYPPMLFHYQGKLHEVKKADGPERIERAWWIDPGELRDYYYLEDQDGKRYWVFRSGSYAAERSDQWFIHGFFA